MTNINKTLKCASCSTDFPLSLVTDLEISDLALMAKCPKCSSAMQVHLGTFGASPQPSSAQPAQSQSTLDDSIFVPPEMPSDEIKKLMEG